ADEQNLQAVTSLNHRILKYMSEHKGKIIKRGNVYYYEDKIQIRITEGCADIIDDRATAFGWLFEIYTDIYRGNAILVNGRPKSIMYVNDEKYTDAVCEVIEKLEKSKERLTTEGIAGCTYYCDREEVRVNSFDEVMETVLKRKPEFR
ncbi:MAG: hypothetical protein LUD27_07390, partial [Clostridia bacterium]|nr:hypothetical protein [Clostridia bacterium]